MRSTITEHERLRRRSGRTVTGLAREMNYSHTYVSRVEGGEIPASPAYRAKYENIVGVPEDWAFNDDGYAK